MASQISYKTSVRASQASKPAFGPKSDNFRNCASTVFFGNFHFYNAVMKLVNPVYSDRPKQSA